MQRSPRACTIRISQKGPINIIRTGRFALEGLTVKDNTFFLAGVKNLKSVNFHLKHDDVILFNGELYQGDEEIR